LARKAALPETKRTTPGKTTAPRPSDDVLVQAKQALNERKFDHAEELLRRSIATNPAGAEAHYLVGVLHEMRDERAAAYAAYRASLLADPEFEPAKLHLMKYFHERIM